MSLFELKTPPGQFQVSWTHKDGSGALLPSCDLERAFQLAQDRADWYDVEVLIEGLGPERGFKRVVNPKHRPKPKPKSHFDYSRERHLALRRRMEKSRRCPERAPRR